MQTSRKYIDCSEFPGSTCTLRIAGTEDEVMKAALQHAVSAHGEADTPQLREEIRSSMKAETGYEEPARAHHLKLVI